MIGMRSYDLVCGHNSFSGTTVPEHLFGNNFLLLLLSSFFSYCLDCSSVRIFFCVRAAAQVFFRAEEYVLSLASLSFGLEFIILLFNKFSLRIIDNCLLLEGSRYIVYSSEYSLCIYVYRLHKDHTKRRAVLIASYNS